MSNDSSRVIFESIKALEIKTSAIFNLDEANNNVLSKENLLTYINFYSS